MLDFEEVKRVKLTDVLGRYGIGLRYRGDWANAPCPLPSHKAGDKGRNFTINLRENYWRCFSESCNEKCGKRGGDVINFVACKEGCSQHEAAKRIAEWFSLNGNKMAEHIARPAQAGSETTPLKAQQDNNPSAIAGKGFMHETGVWLDEVLKVVPGEEERKLARKLIQNKIFESYKNGKAARS